MKILVRNVEIGDYKPITDLSNQLGYQYGNKIIKQ